MNTVRRNKDCIIAPKRRFDGTMTLILRFVLWVCLSVNWVIIKSLFNTEADISSFWRHFHCWLHRNLSFWQLLMQPIMKMSPKWRQTLRFHWRPIWYFDRIKTTKTYHVRKSNSAFGKDSPAVSFQGVLLRVNGGHHWGYYLDALSLKLISSWTKWTPFWQTIYFLLHFREWKV